MTDQIQKNRAEVAETLYQDHDFGEFRVVDSNGWESCANDFTRTLFVEPDASADSGGPTELVTFSVVFQDNSALIKECNAMHRRTGALIGDASGNMDAVNARTAYASENPPAAQALPSAAEKLSLENGKYTVIFEKGQLKAERYGEPWRDLSGDKMIYLMFAKIGELQSELASEKSTSSKDLRAAVSSTSPVVRIVVDAEVSTSSSDAGPLPTHAIFEADNSFARCLIAAQQFCEYGSTALAKMQLTGVAWRACADSSELLGTQFQGAAELVVSGDSFKIEKSLASGVVSTRTLSIDDFLFDLKAAQESHENELVFCTEGGPGHSDFVSTQVAAIEQHLRPRMQG